MYTIIQEIKDAETFNRAMVRALLIFVTDSTFHNECTELFLDQPLGMTKMTKNDKIHPCSSKIGRTLKIENNESLPSSFLMTPAARR